MSQPVVVQSQQAQQTQQAQAQAAASQMKAQKARISLWAAATSFVVFMLFAYVLFRVVNPWWTQQGDVCYRDITPCEKRPPDDAKCFLAAFLLTLFLALIVALLAAAMNA